MSVQIKNTTFDLRITPTKRKRDELKESKSHHQLNYATNNKENHFVYNNFMEVKSIADLIKPSATTVVSVSRDGAICNNAFEVIQKPPKKKNRKHMPEENCFVNPALNLNGPEHVVNPFEVRRSIVPATESGQHCFENNGFTIRGEDRKITNPYEIPRDAPVQGIENPGLEIVQPTPLAIGVPFTPSLGCRIDFKNVPIEALTPSTLMNQLVFSPIKKLEETTPKRANLSIISEEAVDISKELESYQLELENSMNEAKATKKRGTKNLMDIKRKNSFAKRIREAAANEAIADVPSPMPQEEEKEEEKEEKVEEAKAEIAAQTETIADLSNIESHSCHDSSSGHSDCPKSSTPKTPKENCIAKYSMEKSINENPDVVYEEVDETNIHIEMEPKPVNEIDNEQNQQSDDDENVEIFKNPAPFVRAYRREPRKRPPTVQFTTEIATETKPEEKSNEIFGSLRSSIRKSIRKLIHPNAEKKGNADVDSVASEPKEPSTNILTTIRHSLRRKQPKQPLATSTPRESLNDVSIIDAVPRPVFKDAAFAAKLADVNENGFGRTKSHIRSSFRKSSRNVMKTVFKKNLENYAFEK